MTTTATATIPSAPTILRRFPYFHHTRRHPTRFNDRTRRSKRRVMESDQIALMPVYEIAASLGSNLSLAYLGALVALLLGAAYLVVKEVIVRAEMDEAVKRLGDNIRAGNATSEEYYELGAVLIRKKLYVQAVKNLEKSIILWDDDEVELAQVYNAIGFCYFRQEKQKLALQNYKKAVELRPNYTTAWNNIGDVYEKQRRWKDGYEAYKQTLIYDAENETALERADFLKKKMENLGIAQ